MPRRRRSRLPLAAVPLLVLASGISPAHATGPTATATATATATVTFTRAGTVTATRTRFLTENVRSNPTMQQRHVRHDVHKGASLGAVVLWQEITPARYKAAVRGLPDHWRTVQARTEDPISFDQHVWRLVSSHRRALSHGRAGVTPRRWTTWAVLRNRRTGRAFAFMNTHYVSSAWDSRDVSHKAWRKRVWTREWHRQDAVVDRLTGRGLTILGGGDFNRRHLRHFNPRQTNLNHPAIDHLWVIPGASGAVDPRRTRRYRHLYSDHDAVVASVTVG